jgi:hypothetical protein
MQVMNGVSIEASDSNRTKAAKILGIDRVSLWRNFKTSSKKITNLLGWFLSTSCDSSFNR